MDEADKYTNHVERHAILDQVTMIFVLQEKTLFLPASCEIWTKISCILVLESWFRGNPDSGGMLEYSSEA